MKPATSLAPRHSLLSQSSITKAAAITSLVVVVVVVEKTTEQMKSNHIFSITPN